MNTPILPLSWVSSHLSSKHPRNQGLSIEKDKLFRAGVANGPLLVPWSHSHCLPAARAGLTAARIPEPVLDAVTSIPNTFRCHPAQVQISALSPSQRPASGFGVSSPCTTHTDRGALCSAKPLHSWRGSTTLLRAAGAHRGGPWGHTQTAACWESSWAELLQPHLKSCRAEALSPHLQTLLRHVLC